MRIVSAILRVACHLLFLHLPTFDLFSFQPNTSLTFQLTVQWERPGDLRSGCDGDWRSAPVWRRSISMGVQKRSSSSSLQNCWLRSRAGRASCSSGAPRERSGPLCPPPVALSTSHSLSGFSTAGSHWIPGTRRVSPRSPSCSFTTKSGSFQRWIWYLNYSSIGVL